MIETKKMLVKLASYYEKTLSPEQINIYAEQLHGALNHQEMSHACKLYIDDPKNEFFPRPISKLIQLIKTPVSENDVAVDVASRVLEAVSRFGWANEGEAMDYVGEAGKMAVKRFGGWMHICQNLGVDISITTFQAQIREMIKSGLKINQASQSLNQLESSSNVINKLEFKMKELK